MHRITLKITPGKTLLLGIIGLFFSSIAWTQKSDTASVFIIKGLISNCAESEMTLFVRDANYTLTSISIPIKNGAFFCKTKVIQHCQLASLGGSGFRISNLCVAPGYQLTLTADGSDYRSFALTKNIAGIGSISNTYYRKLDSIIYSSTSYSPHFNANKIDFLKNIDKIKALQDSIFRSVFDKTNSEKYSQELSHLIYMESNYHRMALLTNYLFFNKLQFTYNQARDFFEKNNNKYALAHLTDDDNLFLADFSYFIGDGSGYLGYLVTLDRKRDSTIKTDLKYQFEKIEESYSGKMRDEVLDRRLIFEINDKSTYESLIASYAIFTKYIGLIKNPIYSQQVKKILSSRRDALIKDEVGNPASPFSLIDNRGVKHSLNDYKGKVIFLDLWASWCTPCRKETPFLKKIYQKYKNDKRVKFISVAVRDKKKNWERALSEDKPKWLQLIDNGQVNDAYVANGIPKFIVIDKKGKVVTLSAPPPSSGKALEDILNSEITK